MPVSVHCHASSSDDAQLQTSRCGKWPSQMACKVSAGNNVYMCVMQSWHLCRCITDPSLKTSCSGGMEWRG